MQADVTQPSLLRRQRHVPNMVLKDAYRTLIETHIVGGLHRDLDSPLLEASDEYRLTVRSAFGPCPSPEPKSEGNCEKKDKPYLRTHTVFAVPGICAVAS